MVGVTFKYKGMEYYSYIFTFSSKNHIRLQSQVFKLLNMI